jgi:hypothetical protein
VTPTTRISHRAEGPPGLAGLASEATTPPYLANGAQAGCYGSRRRVDVGVWSDAVPRGARGWDPGVLRMPWLLGRFSQEIGAYYCAGTDDGEIGFEGVLGLLCSARERGGQVVHRKHGGHVRREPVDAKIAGDQEQTTEAAPVLQTSRSDI